MKKLNQKKIKWIVRGMDKRNMGAWTIGQQQKISPQHVRYVYKKYRGVKDTVLKKPGKKKPKEITEDERKLVVDTYNDYLVSAAMIELILKEKGVNINHNRIHKIMLKEGLTKSDKEKQKRRRYKCYERKHSNSLWHMDWFQYKRKWHILYEDDASRFITGAGEFRNRNSKKAWKILSKAFKEYGTPKQLHSDNDSTFRANEQEGKKKGECEFEKKVREKGVHQIFARRNHP